MGCAGLPRRPVTAGSCGEKAGGCRCPRSACGARTGSPSPCFYVSKTVELMAQGPRLPPEAVCAPGVGKEWISAKSATTRELCPSPTGLSSLPQHPAIRLSEAKQHPACASMGQGAPRCYPECRAGHRAPAGLMDRKGLESPRAIRHFGANNESLRHFWPNRLFHPNSKCTKASPDSHLEAELLPRFSPREVSKPVADVVPGQLLRGGSASAAATTCCRR